MSWMSSAAATRMAVASAQCAPLAPATAAAAGASAADVAAAREAAALDGFLRPSAASVALVPLLQALYTRQPELMSAGR
jgi:hypothetical protein